MSETAGTLVGSLSIEWALWGKGPQDREYGLIGSSEAAVGKKAFTEVITRYDPGDLDRLPAVTMGWLKLPDQRHYVALAIHDWSTVRDAAGRNVRFTRFFCVPYEQLAAKAVSYGDLYEQLADVELPPSPDQGPIVVRETTIATRPTELSTMVSALLLTNRPVCVLDADTVGLADRVRFLDSVVAQLPYGMRSEMSASTWASANYSTHNIRLFFASAGRRGDDINVHWHAPPNGGVNHPAADQYLAFLHDSGPEVQAELAALIEPVRFKDADITRMVHTVPAAIRRRRQPAPGPEARSAEGILRSIARCLDNGDPPAYLEQDMEDLEASLHRPLPQGTRRDCRAILEQKGLLLEEKPIPADLRPRFYRLLLRVAFAEPVGYQDFLVVENYTGGEFHTALLHVLSQSASDTRTRLLVLNAFGDPGLIRTESLSAADLVRAAAGADLDSRHVRVLTKIVIDYLETKKADLNPAEIRLALAKHGYLATALDRAYPDNLDDQINLLTHLLRLGHGDGLDRWWVTEILGRLEHVPTFALLSAVLIMGGESNADAAEHSFFQGFIHNAPMLDRTRKRLTGLLQRRPDPRAAVLPYDSTAHPEEPGPDEKPSPKHRQEHDGRTVIDPFNALIIVLLIVTWALLFFVLSRE